jgi:hypothetical protein
MNPWMLTGAVYIALWFGLSIAYFAIEKSDDKGSWWFPFAMLLVLLIPYALGYMAKSFEGCQ